MLSKFYCILWGKQWKLASAFTFLWRNTLIGFRSIKFHLEFCVKSFKHSYNNLTIKTKYSLLEEANFNFIKSTKLSLSQEKCKNFHWKMLHHSLSEQIKQLSLAQKKRNNFFLGHRTECSLFQEKCNSFFSFLGRNYNNFHFLRCKNFHFLWTNVKTFTFFGTNLTTFTFLRINLERDKVYISGLILWNQSLLIIVVVSLVYWYVAMAVETVWLLQNLHKSFNL